MRLTALRREPDSAAIVRRMPSLAPDRHIRREHRAL